MKWLAYIIMIVAEWAMYFHLREAGGPPGSYLVLLALMTFVAIFFHEMGHALAVWWAGGTVHRIAVSFISYNVAKRKFQPTPRSKGHEVGGYVSYAFEKRLGTPKKAMIIASAGPAANLLTAGLALLIAMAMVPAPQPSTVTVAAAAPLYMEVIRANPAKLPSNEAVEAALAEYRGRENARFWEILLQGFAMLSLGLALANLVPYGGSDGAAILRNWRKPKPRYGMR